VKGWKNDNKKLKKKNKGIPNKEGGNNWQKEERKEKIKKLSTFMALNSFFFYSAKFAS
jgi:ribonucleotide reductase beta subunit family protein with ferritin-like domain